MTESLLETQEVSAVVRTNFRLRHHLTSFQLMILGFAGVILLGALVLMLPIASAQRLWTPFHEALFSPQPLPSA